MIPAEPTPEQIRALVEACPQAELSADTVAMREPIFWSGVTDELPEGHPLYWTTIYCVRCQQMVHGTPNENMQPWAETGRGPYCLPCFTAAWDEVEPEEWALHNDGEALPICEGCGRRIEPDDEPHTFCYPGQP